MVGTALGPASYFLSLKLWPTADAMIRYIFRLWKDIKRAVTDFFFWGSKSSRDLLFCDWQKLINAELSWLCCSQTIVFWVIPVRCVTASYRWFCSPNFQTWHREAWIWCRYDSLANSSLKSPQILCYVSQDPNEAGNISSLVYSSISLSQNTIILISQNWTNSK